MSLLGDQIKKDLKNNHISQRDAALRCCVAYQNFSSMLSGKRDFSIEQSIQLDRMLGYADGTIAKKQVEEKIKNAILAEKNSQFKNDRIEILKKIKENGGLWSYEGIPWNLDDDEIIEEGLLKLDFEDMNLLFNNWSKSKIKRIWKERLVSQGKRLNILNTLLGIIFFGIKDINKYLARNGN